MTERSKAKRKNSFLLYTTGYTTGISSLTYEDKGKLFDEIFHQAGAINAKKPELSPLLKMAASAFIDALKVNAVKYEATCELRRIAGAAGGKAKAKNMASRNVANVANVANSTYEYDNEYELTTTAKSNLLTITKVGSKYRELPNLAKRSKCYTEPSLVGDDNPFGYDDQPPPDYDPAEAFGGDLIGSDEDSPF